MVLVAKILYCLVFPKSFRDRKTVEMHVNAEMESNRTSSFNDLIVVEISLRMFNEAYCIYSAKPKEVTFRKNSALLRVCLELVALKLKANEKYNVKSEHLLD